MKLDAPQWAAELLHLWFQELGPGDWFSSSDAVDEMLRRRCETVLLEQRDQPLSKHLASPQSALAAIVLFDQIPRNIYRNTAQAFACDAKAVDLSRRAIGKGFDTELPDEARQFLAMPLMHSEDIQDQEMSVAYFSKHLPGNITFAQSHYEMIAKFGRFPHRNSVLGRQTSTEEQHAIDAGFSW